jgi:hypothetical protein
MKFKLLIFRRSGDLLDYASVFQSSLKVTLTGMTEEN